MGKKASKQSVLLLCTQFCLVISISSQMMLSGGTGVYYLFHTQLLSLTFTVGKADICVSKIAVKPGVHLVQ